MSVLSGQLSWSMTSYPTEFRVVPTMLVTSRKDLSMSHLSNRNEYICRFHLLFPPNTAKGMPLCTAHPHPIN